MDDLRVILSVHSRNIVQYIKCLIEQTEKDGKWYSVQWVIYGILVIGHVYTMLLCQTRSIVCAKTGSIRAIGLYIEFIAQLSMIDADNCSSSYTPYTIGCKDAGQFVYKKIFSDIPHDYTNPELSVNLDASSLNVTQVDICLEFLHEYKQINQNMAEVLFIRDLIYTNIDDNSLSYYNNVICRVIEVNTMLEEVPLCMTLYRDIVRKQCANNEKGVHTENMSPSEYRDWMISIISR